MAHSQSEDGNERDSDNVNVGYWLARVARMGREEARLTLVAKVRLALCLCGSHGLGRHPEMRIGSFPRKAVDNEGGEGEKV
ncbi:hypothetical protein IMZ48_25680 [Candidatus Bathyarchaeota archaeon]|nr:hypothetical protein [Candidatus Bathyarchaeota archaeon]